MLKKTPPIPPGYDGSLQNLLEMFTACAGYLCYKDWEEGLPWIMLTVREEAQEKYRFFIQ